MFASTVYSARRESLAQAVGSGAILFLGSAEAAVNFPDNWYPFRQDSSFLYYWGHAVPSLAALIDIEQGRHMLFADNPAVDDVVWSGPQPDASALGALTGATDVRPVSALASVLDRLTSRGCRVHYEPPYRDDTRARLEELLHLRAGGAARYASRTLVCAVVAQRSVKEPREIEEITSALAISRDMHVAAMRLARPGVFEREIAGHVEGMAIAGGGRLAFPCIFSRRGEVLHNHTYGNELQAGDLVVHDSGASSARCYASDITRTIPVSGTFSRQQRAIYECVLGAQRAAMSAMKPQVPFRDVHLVAARSMASDLKALGLMRGDTEEAVAAGAHALFFPHGLGHQMGLDVHDMEGLGEDLVGYDDAIRRSEQFGLAYLRLARPLAPGFVVTVEPGCYFIPALMDQWKAAHRHAEFINYPALDAWRTFGGVRIEDDVLITGDGIQILGPPIPKTVREVEEVCRSQC